MSYQVMARTFVKKFFNRVETTHHFQNIIKEKEGAIPIKEIVLFLLRNVSYTLKYARRNGFIISFNDPIEVMQTGDEIFKHEIYKLYFPKQNPTILDIGANIGLATLYFKKTFPRSAIYAYEPHPLAFKCLKANAKMNEIANVHCLRKAVVAKKPSHKMQLYYSDLTSVVSSRYKENVARFASGKIKRMSVDCISLQEILKNLKSIDILKIDTEGGEFELIPEIAKYSKIIHACIIEVHHLKNKNIFLLLNRLSRFYTIAIDALPSNTVNEFIFSPEKSHNNFLIYAVSKIFANQPLTI